MTKAQELYKKWQDNKVSMGDSCAFYEACLQMNITTEQGLEIINADNIDKTEDVKDDNVALIKETPKVKQKPGTVVDVDLSDDIDYFAYEALSQSSIKQYVKSASEFWRLSYLNPEKESFKETDATIFGNLAHCLLLEPQNFSKQFHIGDWGTIKRDSVSYHKYIGANEELIAGRKVIKQSEFDKAEKMTNFLKKLDFVKNMLNGAIGELPIVWYHSETGDLMKTKIDCIFKNKDGEFIVVDYKTTGTLENDVKVTKNGYDTQFAVIRDAIKCKYGKAPIEYINIIQSTKENDHTNIRMSRVSLETIEITNTKVKQAMLEINERYNKVKAGADPEIAFMNALSITEPEEVHGNLTDLKYWKAFADWCEENKSADRAEFNKYYSEEQLNMYISTLYKQW